MEVDDDSVVDLSVSSSNRRGPPMVEWSTINRSSGEMSARRSLRPRTEVPSYAEAPDVVVVSDDADEPRLNGYTNGIDDSDLSDSEMPPLPPIKELTPAELKEREERERFVRKLRDELRNEEMTLVLLKKLRQSQQMKENIAVVPTTNAQTPVLPPNIKLPSSSSLQITPTSQPVSQPSPRTNHQHPKSANAVPPLIRGQQPVRNGQSNTAPSAHVSSNRSLAPGMPANMHVTSPTTQKGNSRNSNSNVTMSFTASNATDRLKESHHTPSPQTDRIPRLEDNQTPAQRQAAAKLALRKQLEKTLLQIPPPKPPPPEMHFIPNPSNTEFIYLLGLEYIVDYITKSHEKTPTPPEPFRCSQCSTSFTPVWKWEKSTIKGKDPKVICEQCVTTNVKKALKAEHTNRLKTAFVKALQQEQEIEQRLAQSSPQPSEPPPPAPTPTPLPKAATPNHPPPPPPPQIRRNPTPPTPSPVPSPSPREHPLAKLAAETNKFNSHHAAAALHQQLLRGLPPHQAPLPAHIMPFSHLLYPYQLAMAQAASGKGTVAAAAANLVELQRQAADLQRQYLLDLIPPPSSSRSHGPSLNNWKT